MLHHRQRLSLRFEPRDDVARVHSNLNNLQRHASANWLCLLSQINYSAASLADLLEQLVTPNSIPGFLEEHRGAIRIDRRFLLISPFILRSEAELKDAPNAMPTWRIRRQLGPAIGAYFDGRH